MKRAEFSESQAALPLDTVALGQYLEGRLAGFEGDFVVRKFAGGQSNPTYKVEAAGRAWVLRKKPTGTLLPTAHMVDREYRVLSGLADTDVPVARPLLYCSDAAVIGTEFFIMEYVQGRIFWDPTLPELAASERRELYDEMVRVLGALHRIDYRSRGLGDYGRPGNYFARQIKRWSEQYASSSTDRVVAMDELMVWLPAHVPDDDTTTLVHGDFRLDNMIFHPREPRVLAVLDWELSTLGHPLADLAYNCMPYHLASPDRPALSLLAGAASGIPTEAEYVAAYAQQVGRSGVADFSFYLAFSLFRYASIVQGVYRRGLLGNASSGAEAISYRQRVLDAAEVAWALVG